MFFKETAWSCVDKNKRQDKRFSYLRLVLCLMIKQVALCVPEEDGMTVHSATQGIDCTQAAVAQTLNFPVKRYESD